MNKEINEKIRASISMPEPFTGIHYEAYARIGRENSEMTIAGARYLQALEILESAEIEVGDKTLDLVALKKRGIDVPFAVVTWVGATVRQYVDDQFELPKNSSEPPSNSPVTTAPETTQ